MATTQLKRPSDFDIIETARLYSLNPQLMKARAFAYFQAGFSAGETCLILKTQIKGRSIQTYYSAWKEMSQLYDTISAVEHAPVEGDGVLAGQTVQELRAELQVERLEERIASLESDLATANSHPLRIAVAHARGGCAECQQDLEQHNQAVIMAAFKRMTPAQARELAVAKGVLPKTLNFHV